MCFLNHYLTLRQRGGTGYWVVTCLLFPAHLNAVLRSFAHLVVVREALQSAVIYITFNFHKAVQIIFPFVVLLPLTVLCYTVVAATVLG
jgi:hypothetical protein